MHGRTIRCSGRFLLPFGKYNDARHWSDSMVHRQRHVGNIRTWSKEVGAVCSTVYLHGTEHLCGLECFYGRGDMSEIVLSVTPIVDYFENIVVCGASSGMIYTVLAFVCAIMSCVFYNEKIPDWKMFALMSMVFWGCAVIYAVTYFGIFTFKVI
jgi:hypothetical protein